MGGSVGRGGIKFRGNEVIGIGGMLGNNGLIGINVGYENLEKGFVEDVCDIEWKVRLGGRGKVG
ncbi:hypothetical protein [Staphylococcus epidermidis]|nr:hypothetical protein [Staphylococcus epidermidis]